MPEVTVPVLLSATLPEPDFSAVDQDIVITEGHAIRIESDYPAAATLRVDRDKFNGRVVVEQTAGNSEVVVPEPGGDMNGSYVKLVSGSWGTAIIFWSQNNEAGFTFANGRLTSYGDLAFDAGSGPVLTAPDGARYRLIVANDRTLSTEPVV